MDGFGRARFVYEPPLLAGFPDAAAIGIRPRVAPPPLVRVGVRIETEVGPRTAPVVPVDVPARPAESCTPIKVYLFETPSRSDSGFWSYAAYANDSWRVSNRLTSNLGLRFDRYRVFLPDQAHPPGRFNRMLQTFPAVDNLINWNVLAPPDALLGGRLFRLIDCRRRAAEAGRAERIQAVPLDGSDRPARTGRACCPAWPGTWLSRYSSSRSSQVV